MKFTLISNGWLILLIALFLMACTKFEGAQEVPSYIQVDSLTFTTDYSTEGTDNHNLLDAWVYVDDQLIGGFELPARFPVLDEGKCKVEIRAGIKLNGISDTRAPYPCLKSYIRSNVSLVPDSVVVINPSFTYLDNVEFIWREDFEDESLAIKEGNGSDTNIFRTYPANSPEALLDENSEYSGVVYLDDERSNMELVTDNGDGGGFALRQGDFVFLEINCKSTTPVLVGMYIRRTSIGGVENRPFIMLNSSEDWNKVYINFTPIVNEYPDATEFKVYFMAEKAATESDQKVMFDNIKILTRPNL
jgi:hypothetical protein